MNAALTSIRDAKTILLTTYKRDGTPVATPVSVAFDGERPFFLSYDKAWKTRRLRRNPAVQAAPAPWHGRHRVLQAILVPTAHRLMRYRTLHYELVPP